MTLLFVCHANLCRSVLAERLARTALAEHGSPVAVASAGTHARPGLPMPPMVAAALRAAGADDTGFASRALSVDALAGADLVLTAGRTERAICVTQAPAVLRRAFTIRQFGRLAAALLESTVDIRPLPGLLDQIARVRGGLQPVAADEDDLADPIAGTAEDMRACVALIRQALSPTVTLIARP